MPISRLKRMFRLQAAHFGMNQDGLQEVWLRGGAHDGERRLAPLPPEELVIPVQRVDGSPPLAERYAYISGFAADGRPVMVLVDLI
jgi:hypothetical protein